MTKRVLSARAVANIHELIDKRYLQERDENEEGFTWPNPFGKYSLIELGYLDEKWKKLSDHLHKRLNTWLFMLFGLKHEALDGGRLPFATDGMFLLEYDTVKNSIRNLYKKMDKDNESDFQEEFDESFDLIKSTIFKAIETTFGTDKATRMLLNSGIAEDAKDKITIFLFRKILGYVTDDDYTIHDVNENQAKLSELLIKYT